MRTLLKGLLCSASAAALLVVGGLQLRGAAQTGPLTITVDLDETTAGELALVDAFVGAAAEGAEVPRPIRRIAMAAAGEVAVAVDARVDLASETLALDDGSSAALPDGADVFIKIKVRGAYPVFECKWEKDTVRHCRPTSICWWGKKKCIEIPPLRLKRIKE